VRRALQHAHHALVHTGVCVEVLALPGKDLQIEDLLRRIREARDREQMDAEARARHVRRQVPDQGGVDGCGDHDFAGSDLRLRERHGRARPADQVLAGPQARDDRDPPISAELSAADLDPVRYPVERKPDDLAHPGAAQSAQLLERALSPGSPPTTPAASPQAPSSPHPEGAA
jgi:hypothetical protein